MTEKSTGPLRFLSASWVAAFNDAVRDLDVPAAGPEAGLGVRDGAFSMRQVVRGGPDGEACTTLRLDGGVLSMDSGEWPTPDVTIVLDWADAVSMVGGRLAPAEALAAGRVRVRGDLSVLTAGQSVLAAAAPRLEELRARTAY
ncbi:MAG: SCP2 sterol-binding domain-containing protein [Acidimicrobiales bacterium]